MSRIVAPESMKDCRVGVRDEGVGEWTPPSEKESGVRFRTAMMRVWRAGLRDWMGGRDGVSGVNGDRGMLGGRRDFSCVRNVGARVGDGRVPLGMRL